MMMVAMACSDCGTGFRLSEPSARRRVYFRRVRDTPPPRWHLVAGAIVFLALASACTHPLSGTHTPAPPPTMAAASPAGSAAISVSAGDSSTGLRCTATFPSRSIQPGSRTRVRFALLNTSDRRVSIAVGAGNGAEGYLVERDARGNLLQDTARVHNGIIGGRPRANPVAPGASFSIPALDAPVLWPGPILVTPVCPIGSKKPVYLPPIKLHVRTEGSAPARAHAIARAAAVATGRPHACARSGAASQSSGANMRCDFLVIPHRGFDIVVVAAYSPKNARSVKLRKLAYDIDAFTFLKLHGNESVVWRVVVVTGSGARQVRASAVSECHGDHQAENGPMSGGACSRRRG